MADGTINFQDTKPAYSDVTKLFIRASGRLLLNAPTLSLRTITDIPDELLKEAAYAMLSGRAHPILLNDEKIIKGLYQSGCGIGGKKFVKETRGWNSKVSMKSAQNYACD